MTEQTRQLAAIMFSDIVGYTEMMGQDESHALEIIRRNRCIQKPLVEKHNGKWIKEMGDGVLARFNSALDAVNCAREIQLNTGDQFDAKLRIGIHIGDITFENGDVFGEGVNIAARLESIAEPGSIFISDSVYNAIKSRSNIPAGYIGEKFLKNVKDPVRVYSIKEGEFAENKSTVSRNLILKGKYKYLISAVILIMSVIAVIWRNGWGISDKISNDITLAVLPIESINKDTTDQYLVEGLTEELIRSLGKIVSISVINPISVMRYLGSVQSVTEVRRDLKDANYLIKGTFEKQNNIIDLNIELRNEENELIWSDMYQQDMARMPELVGNITADISKAIDIELSSAETSRIKDIEAVNPEIYELWLKGMNHLNRFTAEDFKLGIMYLKEAVDLNPADARAWAGLAEGYVYLGHGPSPPPGVWQMAKTAAVRAIQLDSTLAEAWASLAHTKTYFEWDYNGAEICYRKANSLNPNLAMNHYHYAWHLDLFGRLDEAIEEHKLAQKLDPFQPLHSAWLGMLLAESGRYDEALAEAHRSLEIVKDYPLGHFIVGYTYMAQGKYDSAIIAFQKAASLQTRFRYMELPVAYIKSGQVDKGMHLIHELENLPINSINAYLLALSYSETDSLDKFFKYANYEPAHAWAPWFRVNIKNPLVIRDPRFKILMDKMNLPMPDIAD